MKRLSLLVYIIGCSLYCTLPAVAETPQPDTKRYYITLQTIERTTGKSAGTTINVGPIVAQKAQLTRTDLSNLAKYRFPSPAEAMNYLVDYGWQLSGTYAYNVAGSAVVTWVVYKDVVKDTELGEGLAIDE